MDKPFHQEQRAPQGPSGMNTFLPENYVQDFIQAMHRADLDFKEDIIGDGVIRRFSTGNKSRKDGWYVFYGLAGAFGDWSKDIHGKWSLKTENLPPQEKEHLVEQIEKAKQDAEEERVRKYEGTAAFALEKWDTLSEEGSSPYLLKKKVGAFGVRFGNDVLVVPLKDIRGKLWSLQWINPDSSKRFLTGGRKNGCFHSIGTLEDGKPIIIVEGYATGASVHMATQQTTVIAFDAGSLEPVIVELKRSYPKSPLLIAGDDDIGRERNMGREKAEEASRKYGCSIILPKFKDLSTNPTDFNDLMLLEGKAEVNQQIDNALQGTRLKALSIRDLLSMEIRPREMILSPILPEQGLAMIHAPRGIGKTQVSLTIAYTVATGGQMFHGKWVNEKPSKVLFVDGEMPLAVMQERLARIVHSAEEKISIDDNLRIITPDIQNQGISDLSTPEGQQVIEEHLKDVKLLILDNYSALCRRGRENESESWVPLQEWFLNLRRRGISVLLIHHSNKNGAQRGTSKKEDLLDTVITLRKPENYDPREGARFEVHYEKARSFYGDEATPFEASLKEEDGKFVWQVKKIENPQMDQIVNLHKGNLSQRAIAETLGVSPATVNRRLKEKKEKISFND